MKSARALLRVAGFFFGMVCATAAEVGKVCDRYGVVLMEVARSGEDRITKKFPLKAFAAHLLSDLSPSVLPKPGETVYLTIDARAQMAAEQALRAVPRGCAILVDPASGDILAMASVPSFDPGAFDEAIFRKDETDPLRNRAVSAYAPGATFLPVTALAGLSAGLSSFEYTCTGSMTFGSRVMKCWIAGKGGGHGRQTLAAGMKNSCNTFFYQFGVTTGPDRMTDMAELLGFGRVSGLPLRNEAIGLVAVKAELKKTFPPPKFPATYEGIPDWIREWLAGPRGIWTPGLSANMAIGQGSLLVTPLQMSSLAATLSNGGDIHAPRLIDRILRRNGTVEREVSSVRARLGDAGLSRKDIDIVRDAMIASVNESGGNARKGAAPGFRVGGRTGTAQFWRNGLKDNHTAFIGFADSGEKNYAFSVFVQGAKSGGGVAAPLAARILGSLEKSEPAPLEPAVGSFSVIGALP